tara:strand:+ start:166 stop:516 length:351 start_codon:yes stop_codon:yes gene_type:complete
MLAFRVLLVVLFATLSVYSVVVVAADGVNFVVPFLRDIFAVGWAGQFNLDFAMFLLLAAIWIMWRADFSPGSIGLALCIFGGAVFFCAYLFYLTMKQDDPAVLLLGERRAAALGAS